MTLLLEYWKPVVGFEDYYEISSMGNLRSKHRPSMRFAFRNYPFIAPAIDRRGYPSVVLKEPKGRKLSTKVHVLVARAFLGEAPQGHEVNHMDGCQGNPRLSNLEYVTHAQNMEHAGRTGLMRRGTDVHLSKLNEGMVREIRKLKGVMEAKEVGVTFGVTPGPIYAIWKGVTWKHVD